MTMAIDRLQTVLKMHNLSITSPRQVVFEALQHKEPISMHGLWLACQQKIDRATLYRTITLFERLGVVARLQIGWKYKLELSNNFQHHHHHLSCRKCDAIIPLPEDERLEQRLHELAAMMSFQPDDHQIEVRGLCKTCQALALKKTRTL